MTCIACHLDIKGYPQWSLVVDEARGAKAHPVRMGYFCHFCAEAMMSGEKEVLFFPKGYKSDMMKR